MKAKMRKAFQRIGISSLLLTLTLAKLAAAQTSNTIVTDNVVPLKEVVSPNGFVHPGISCNAETLSVVREKVIAGVSPWVDYFEGLRRTPYAQLDRRPRLVDQITNDGGIYGYANDAQTLWAQTIIYVVTGDEAYRKRPVEIIKWYGGRTDKVFFPHAFADAHIKIGKYVYTMCSAVDILRTIEPKDKSLAVTQEMVDALSKNCIAPIRKNCIEQNYYFMNQHSYAVMGFLAGTILTDDVEGYKRAVEWTTVNATAANQGRNGSIKQQIRVVTRNDKTGQPVEPNLQLVEMGRDQPHANGNLDNLLMMSKTIDFQHTRVDPVNGTVTEASNGVLPIHFLDDRLLHGLMLAVRYNMGYGIPWVPTYSEKSPDNTATFDQISYFGRGSWGPNQLAAGYYYYRGMGFDLNQPQYALLKVALDGTAVGRERGARSGEYINTLHNYAFDFWIGLPATASDAKPDPAKAQRALAPQLPPLEIERDGVAVDGLQFEYNFFDLSAHAAQPGDIYPGSPQDIPLSVERDSDGTGYVRMTLNAQPRTIVTNLGFPKQSGLRVRTDKLVRLAFHKEEDYSKRPLQPPVVLPNTGGAWTDITMESENRGLLYIEATPLDGAARVDFDRIDDDPAKVTPLAYTATDRDANIPTYVGVTLDKVFPVTTPGVTYEGTDLPTGAALDAATGRFTWTPQPDQVGDHVFYVTAKSAVSSCTLPVKIHVAKDLQAALDDVAKVYQPNEKYETPTLKAFQAALASKDLDALIQAADQLRLLNPRLADGSLDYCKTWSYTIKDSAKMADGDPLSWGGEWGFDKNVTMDFGRNFKVKSKAFGLQARNGFPIRVSEAVVYGSNNGFDWTLLTENAAKNIPDFQVLAVKKPLQDTAYRFIRFFMPAKAYGIFEISELRIYGERVEDYSPDYHRAYIKGFEDGTFRPDQPVTRAVAASSLASVTSDYTDKGNYSCNYSDVPANAPYHDDLAYLTQKGIMAATHGKAFEPNAPLTRGQFATALARINKLAGRPEIKLGDVTSATPNATEIALVAQKGWLNADGGLFHPNDPVTRAQFVTAINLMLGRDDGGGKSGSPFKDVRPSYPAYDAIMEATHAHTAG